MPSMLATFFFAQYWRTPSLPLRADHWSIGRSMTLEGHQGNAVATRVRHPSHVDHDHRAHPDPCSGRKTADQSVEVRVVGEHDPARPMQTHDPWRPREGAEHDDDPAVLPEVGDGLDAAPRLVEVGHRAARRAPRTRLRLPLGEQFTEPSGSSGSGRHEEHGLVQHPSGQDGIDPCVALGHPRSIASRPGWPALRSGGSSLVASVPHDPRREDPHRLGVGQHGRARRPIGRRTGPCPGRTGVPRRRTADRPRRDRARRRRPRRAFRAGSPDWW